MDKKATIDIIKRYIKILRKNKYSVQRTYIFGSYAKDNYNEDSDIDLAIVLKDMDNSFLTQIDLMKLARRIDTRIEPHPFVLESFNSLNPFANEILKTGIEVKQSRSS